jgi:5-methylcytosine-specific restriction endonuclease McrA
MFANHVFVVDRNLKPLKPCMPEVARILQKVGKAHRFRLYPFTIRLNKEVNQEITPFLTLKIDPGSKFTGLALLDGDFVIWGMELEHRGSEISQSLLKRSAVRRSRRNRQTRYRKWRKHHRPEGWLAPSLQHRVDTVSTWVRRLIKLTPIKEICLELVRFDLQKIENPEISGVEYQQGELFGYEVKQYLLEKWGRKCDYCDAENIPLEVDRIHPKSKGGTDRVANLTLACRACNQAKGNEEIKDFLSGKADRLKKVLTQAKQPLKDASAVNSTRWALFNALKETELLVSTGSGGLTKFNRTRLGLPKTHWLDATCVGAIEGLKL